MFNYSMLKSSSLQRVFRKCIWLQLYNFKPKPICVGIWARKINKSAVWQQEWSSKEQSVNSLEASDNDQSEHVRRLHVPVMLNEVINWLEPQQGQCILDMTFGAGGHTKSILQQTPDVKIYALDRDPTAFKLAQQLSQSYPQQICALLGRFSQAESLLVSTGLKPGTLDGVLLDVGCSSMQLDTPERGFSLRKDGPLDMRMDSDKYPGMPTAADVVNALDQQALASILKTYGEERHAKKIASAVIQARSIYPITRTQQLASIVAGAFPAAALYARKDLLQRPTHVATKTFQALRIFVNDELNELYTGLQTAQVFLKPGGRLVAISFHSLEDRIIKRFLYGTDVSEKPNLSIRQKIRHKRNFEGREDKKQFSNSQSNWIILQKKEARWIHLPALGCWMLVVLSSCVAACSRGYWEWLHISSC
ncbi:probable methyltransferase-like protein 15 isoform X2 [Rhinatrema bivittatum]|uniref:probable methyltransferase-like protein 15 isoform X2 n=1 Tax=Rhinatrema bivittatum TaxID=194408 RepID=UPI00112DC75A|nr:probable methyltransferase-like protein 15 isoform X2 [Rhinatrema bivittatum]